MAQSLGKTVWCFLTELNLFLPYDPEITLLGIYSKKLNIYVHTKTLTQMFVAAFLITAKA